MSEYPIEDTLIETIAKSGGYSVLKEGVEFGLDQVIANEELRNVPVIGVLWSVCNGVIGVREYFFLKKLIRFLTALDHNKNEVAEYATNLTLYPEEKRKLAARLFLVLDKIGDLEKSDFVAKAFVALASGKISMDMFLRFLDVIDRSFFPDLVLLQMKPDRKGFSRVALDSLSNSGLLSLVVMSSYSESMDGFTLNELGKSFIEHVLTKSG